MSTVPRPASRAVPYPGSGSRAPLRVLPLAALVLAWLGVMAGPASAGPSRLEATDTTFIARLGDGNDLVVRAERADFSPSRHRARLFDVTARVADGAKASVLSFACQQLDLNLRSHNLDARGDVRGETADGIRYATEHIRYERAAERLSGDAPIRMESDTGIFRGDGFVYYLRDQRFRLRGRVRLEQRP